MWGAARTAMPEPEVTEPAQMQQLLAQLQQQSEQLGRVQAEWERRQAATPRSLRVRLGDGNYEVRLDALEELSDALGDEELSLADSTVVARRLREEGSLARLALLLVDDSNEVLTRALYCLGNLCSDSFDTASRETKRLLLDRDGKGACGEDSTAFAALSPSRLPLGRALACSPALPVPTSCAAEHAATLSAPRRGSSSSTTAAPLLPQAFAARCCAASPPSTLRWSRTLPACASTSRMSMRGVSCCSSRGAPTASRR